MMSKKVHQANLVRGASGSTAGRFFKLSQQTDSYNEKGQQSLNCRRWWTKLLFQVRICFSNLVIVKRDIFKDAPKLF